LKYRNSIIVPASVSSLDDNLRLPGGPDFQECVSLSQ